METTITPGSKGMVALPDEKGMVKYDNRLNRTNELNGLSIGEQNVIFTLFSKLTENKSSNVEISRSELKKFAGLSGTFSDKQYQRILNRISEVMMSLKFYYRTDKAEVWGVLFPTFSLTTDKETFIVSLNPEAKEYFYQIEGGFFSHFLLTAFLDLHSRFSKALFRAFIHRFYGKCELTVDELKELLQIKSAYQYKDFQKRLPVILDELRASDYFLDLTYKPEYGPGRGKPIIKYTFRYKINHNRTRKLAGQIFGEIKTCPFCGAPQIDWTDPQGRHWHLCENSMLIRRGSADCTWSELIQADKSNASNSGK